MNVVTQFASETASSNEGIFQALGIDWRLLIFQIIGFLIVVFVMGKFIFPVLNKSIDQREAAIRESADMADKARKDALEAEERIARELEEARRQAAEPIEIAHKEAAAMITDAEEKAAKKSDHIIKQAEARLQTDIAEARKTLKTETAELVALATGKIVREKVDAKKDASLIKEAIEEAK